SERAIQHELDQIARHRTTLVIAHRLATVRHADPFVVEAHGRIGRRGLPAQGQRTGGPSRRTVAFARRRRGARRGA
ncbi:metal ABC transporter permease, partial [Burkholderia pseudomallei]